MAQMVETDLCGPSDGERSKSPLHGNACFWNIDQAMFTMPND